MTLVNPKNLYNGYDYFYHNPAYDVMSGGEEAIRMPAEAELQDLGGEADRVFLCYQSSLLAQYFARHNRLDPADKHKTGTPFHAKHSDRVAPGLNNRV